MTTLPAHDPPSSSPALGAITPRRGRGRPPKSSHVAVHADASDVDFTEASLPKRPRGRPRTVARSTAERNNYPAKPPARTPGPRSMQAREYLGLDHFVFYRGYLEGVALATLAQQYLETGLDLRMAKTTLIWVQARLLAGARREKDRAAERLLAIPREQLQAASEPPGAGAEQPTLEQFAEMRDPYEVYSQRELLELFEEEFPQGRVDHRRETRNERLREKQVRALFRLQQLLATRPQAHHHLAGWFHPSIAQRLETVGVFTLHELMDFITLHGKRWHVRVARLGSATALRLQTWLKANHESLGREVDPRALAPRRSVAPAVLRSLRVQVSGIAPIEYLLVPPELTGAHGVNRYQGPVTPAILARDDKAAIAAWISLQPNPAGNTATTYRGHAERFLLWMLFAREKALSDAGVDDVIAYRSFLADPQPATRWVNTTRGVERHRPEWRPFSGPASANTIRHAMSALSSLCAWLVNVNYLGSNPFAGVPKPKARSAAGKMDVVRSLSRKQWDIVRDCLKAQPQAHPAIIRKQFLVRYAYLTGKRLSELAAARAGDLAFRSLGEGAERLVLSVVGKGGKLREIELPEAAKTLIEGYFASRGYPADLRAVPADVPVIGRLKLAAGEPFGMVVEETVLNTIGQRVNAPPLGSERVATIFREIFEAAAAFAGPDKADDAEHLRAATPHWMRHTFGTLAAERIQDLTILRDVMGHASIATTNQYLHTDALRRARGMDIAITSDDIA